MAKVPLLVQNEARSNEKLKGVVSAASANDLSFVPPACRTSQSRPISNQSGTLVLIAHTNSPVSRQMKDDEFEESTAGRIGVGVSFLRDSEAVALVLNLILHLIAKSGIPFASRLLHLTRPTYTVF